MCVLLVCESDNSNIVFFQPNKETVSRDFKIRVIAFK